MSHALAKPGGRGPLAIDLNSDVQKFDEVSMNFIESIFHLAPDHGSGLLEAGILLAGFTVVSLVVTLFRRRRVRRLLL